VSLSSRLRQFSALAHRSSRRGSTHSLLSPKFSARLGDLCASALSFHSIPQPRVRRGACSHKSQHIAAPSLHTESHLYICPPAVLSCLRRTKHQRSQPWNGPHRSTKKSTSTAKLARTQTPSCNSTFFSYGSRFQ